MGNKFYIRYLIGVLMLLCAAVSSASTIEIDRFEHINTDNGLSQNTVTSLHCDQKGFLWIGTMNGLNRYDGYDFKVYRNKPGQIKSLTHNRIVNIWEDAHNFLWFETYDGYYHFFNSEKETFSTLPKYSVSSEEKFSKISCFTQYNNDQIWLGSSNSGVYLLTYDPEQNTYKEKQFLSRGQYPISNNNIRFIVADNDSNIWIGTSKGLNLLKREDYLRGNFYFQHFFAEMSFTSAVSADNEVWFGTDNNGVAVYDLNTRSFKVLDSKNSIIDSNAPIVLIHKNADGNIVIGSSKLYFAKPGSVPLQALRLDGTLVTKMYEDLEGILWVTTQNFGVYHVDQMTLKSKYFDLTPSDNKYLSDRERPFFFEDSQKNLWICVHGGGLVNYNRQSEVFNFYRNDPSNPNSISSNTVMCMTEDHNGNLWVGTSLQGGLNKIIVKNPAFTSRKPHAIYDDFVENIVRSLMQDMNENIWVSSKGGDLLVFSPKLEPIKPAIKNPFDVKVDPVFNVYAMLQDSKGHIWLGAKGGGVRVSKKPVNKGNTNYAAIEWYKYIHNQSNPSSLVNDDVYSIAEDGFGRVWIGTYGGGVSFADIRQYDKLVFKHVTSVNSNLSSNQIRNLFVDSRQNLWVSTIFGINQLKLNKNIPDSVSFVNYIHNPEKENSLVYNDAVHGFEDSQGNLWFGTFGGGVNRLNVNGDSLYRFMVLNESHGLVNDEVFGILEDNMGFLWFSTENGLSRFDPNNSSFENFNKSNSLSSNGFSENTCLKLADGRLVFGHSKGFEVVDPDIIKTRATKSNVTFTNFQLFNIPVDVHSPGSPLEKSILYTTELTLGHAQSSFSIEYSAMNYLDESKTQYAYYLENFDKSWNYVGSDRKATYTNLKPGKYTFRVKAALWNGRWDEPETVLQIVITPPWWRSSYAYMAYLTLFILLSFIASRIFLSMYTYRNQLKIEKAVNEVKLQFFTNISHEIRTPLTLILGPIEDVLADKGLPEKFKVPLQLMQRNGKRMLHLLNQLLDFRKVQNRKMNLRVTATEIGHFTNEVFKNFEAFARHKGIAYRYQNNLPETQVWIDPKRMDSVVFNILSNAFKHTPRGEDIVMTVSESPNNDEIYIAVCDKGPGISSKDIPLLFERYTILSNLQTENQGTGIGLHLSSEIVKMHGGSIKVESNPDCGSTFIIVLKKGNGHFAENPAIIIDQTASLAGYVKDPLADIMLEHIDDELIEDQIKDKTEKPLLLVVEDNAQILKYIEDAFADRFSIVKAVNGKEGLEKIAEKQPDLVISDVMMPVMDGIEMTKAIKADFNTCHIPVFLLTAKTAVDDQIHGIEAGAEAYILKPFNMGVLKSMVNNLLIQRKMLVHKHRDKQEIPVSDLKFTSRDQEFLGNLVKYIEENYNDQELTINRLAEFSCVSRTVFYNKVKTLTGTSPVEFLRQIKLKIAAKMLENGYNVSEAALNIGFNDTRYFSRQFKDLFGESPSQYKKRHTGVDDEPNNQ